MNVLCDLWAPLYISRNLEFAPVPMRVWFLWHVANAETIAASWAAAYTTRQEAT